MASFIDSNGREWTLTLTAPVIDKVRSDGDKQFLLGANEPSDTLSRLADDPAAFCHTIYHLCERQRNERNIPVDAFYSEVIGNGDAIQSAGEALEKALLNFTPTRKREFTQKIVGKQRTVEQLAMDKTLLRIDDPELLPQIEQALDEKLDEIISRLTRQKNVTALPDSAV